MNKIIHLLIIIFTFPLMNCGGNKTKEKDQEQSNIWRGIIHTQNQKIPLY